ncbi:MAG: Lrp/AsnC family transcriptional regulator, partial [Candidatus Eremiobacteraeota bacterium]|nr:Lrp/AsnC family transcriptional regulator [Candidatus Eremiobacteraeota bacterium]
RNLDETDWKLISELERDARQSFSELGRKIGLSQPATAERIKALESAGVIRGYRVDVDREKLGYTIEAFIRMETEGEKCHGLQRIVERLPEVLECHRVTGDGSYILRAALQSVSHLETLIDRLLPFGSPTTSIVLSTPLAPRNVRLA